MSWYLRCARLVFGITFVRYTQSQQIGKLKNINVFGKKISKQPKQDSQNRLWWPVPGRLALVLITELPMSTMLYVGSRLWTSVEETFKHNTCKVWFQLTQCCPGADQEGGGGVPPKIWKKIWFDGVKSWFFTRNTPTHIHASLRSAQFFYVHPP